MIRSITINDVDSIYELMKKAFPGVFLNYTIYQTPQSVHYLRKIISEKKKNEFLFKAINQDGINGYYHAVLMESNFHLNYIAVRSDIQGKGIGRELLQHFEETGVSLGAKQLSLHVFSENVQAKNIYLHYSYDIKEIIHYAQIDLSSVNAQNLEKLSYKQMDWLLATKDEKENGFSKIECTHRNGKVQIGIIGGKYLKILKYNNICPLDLIKMIANTFGMFRSNLIVTFLSDVPQNIHLLDHREVVYMLKQIKN